MSALEVALDLVQQASFAHSKLRAGSLTRYTHTITCPAIQVRSLNQPLDAPTPHQPLQPPPLLPPPLLPPAEDIDTGEVRRMEDEGRGVADSVTRGGKSGMSAAEVRAWRQAKRRHAPPASRR